MEIWVKIGLFDFLEGVDSTSETKSAAKESCSLAALFAVYGENILTHLSSHILKTDTLSDFGQVHVERVT